jgi:hypothetical protein
VIPELAAATVVRDQQPDVPHDSEDPLFPIGFGLEL